MRESARAVNAECYDRPPFSRGVLSVELFSSSRGLRQIRVQLVRVTRHGDGTICATLTVAIRFEGDYGESYTDGDNTACCRPTP